MKNSSKKKSGNSKAKNLESPKIQSFHNDAPMTRREFLARGLVAGTGMIVAPTALSLLASQAYGQESGLICPAPAVNNKVKTFVVDLAGGWNSTGANFIVGGAGGQLDLISDYSRYGLTAASTPSVPGMINTEFGIAMHEFSGFLAGLKSATSVAARACVDGVVLGGVSNDDTGSNPHNAVSGFCAGGASGSLVNTVGSRSGGSGGNSTFASFSFKPSYAANQVTNRNQLQSFAQAGLIATNLGPEKARRVYEAASRVSERHIASLSAQSMPDQYKTLISCGYLEAKDLPTRFTPAQLDPINDPNYIGANGVFGTAFDGNTLEERVAVIAKAVLDGYAGVGTITDGGYDYHNNARAATDPTDFRAGRMVGWLIELAHRTNSKIMIQLISDGAISCGTNVETIGKLDANGAQTGETITKFTAQNDNGNFGSQVLLVVNGQTPRTTVPILKATPAAQGRQVSVFRDRGVDTNSSLVANNVNNLAKLALMSWLSLNGEESRLVSIAGDDPFSTSATPEKYLLFNKIT